MSEATARRLGIAGAILGVALLIVGACHAVGWVIAMLRG